MDKVTKGILKEIFPERKREVYYRKYEFGLLIVIGGSEFYSGSPALSAMAAFNAGVDMVRIIAPRRAADIIASFSPNMAAYPLEGKWLNGSHLAELVAMTKAAESVARGNVAAVIGGGAGRSKETQEVILEYLSRVNIPVVIDADAIHAVGSRTEVIKGKPFLITPHLYEFMMLTGRDIREFEHGAKIQAVKEEALRLQTTILLKEKPDIISNGKEAVLNESGSPYMSVGGTGDTLAGICGALLARRIEPFKAAQAAVFVNGKAGELAASRMKEGLSATEVIKAIPEVLH